MEMKLLTGLISMTTDERFLRKRFPADNYKTYTIAVLKRLIIIFIPVELSIIPIVIFYKTKKIKMIILLNWIYKCFECPAVLPIFWVYYCVNFPNIGDYQTNEVEKIYLLSFLLTTLSVIVYVAFLIFLYKIKVRKIKEKRIKNYLL
jgi:hypothetical protein